jgi:hypothetical protein
MRNLFQKLFLVATILGFSECSAPAYTQQSRVWIAEFATGRVEAQAPFAKLQSATHQPTLDISTGNAKSAFFAQDTVYIRIICEVPCQIKIGGNANGSSVVLGTMRPEYFGVDPGSQVSILAIP